MTEGMSVETAQEINNSRNWMAVCEELDLWIQAEMNKLRTCVPDQLHEIQSRLDILEKVKNLPQIVIDSKS